MCVCVYPESVGVGVVLRNPLKVPLVMRSLALTWSHTPLPSNTQAGGSSVGEGERARADVMERIILQPLSEKMVSPLNLNVYLYTVTFSCI